MDISVVVPLYDEVESLPELTSWISRVMDENRFTYEIILIDDGSSDGSWEMIRKLQTNNPFIKGIKFRRNYGKSAALNTGFEAAQGNVVITMDADLQDSPDEIPELYRRITEEKYDLISGLKAYRKAVVKNIEVYGEMHRYIPVIAKWAGFVKIGEQVVEHRPRKYGRTKFGISRFVNGLLDLMSIFFVGKFGKRPMHFFGTLGVLSFFAGTIIAIWIICEKLYLIAHNEKYRDIT